MAKKYGLTDKEVMDKFEHKIPMRMEIEPKYSNLQVRNKEIWGNVVAVLLLTVQGKCLLGDYMTPTLYYTISSNSYLTPSDKGTNTMNPPGAIMAKQ